MKHTIILWIFLCFPLYIFSQNTLLLKSGEKFNGKVTEYKKGQLKFLFKNNVLTFSDKDIASVIFDSTYDERSSSKMDATIKGVVTYYFNKNYGYKPDVGAKIFILNKADLGEADTLLIKNFLSATLIRKILSLNNLVIDESSFNQLSKLNAETEDKFNELDMKASKAVMLIESNKKTVELFADGNGSFSKSLKAGDYSVLIESKHRHGISSTEVLSKIYYKRIKLLKNAEEIVNAEFDEL